MDVDDNVDNKVDDNVKISALFTKSSIPTCYNIIRKSLMGL